MDRIDALFAALRATQDPAEGGRLARDPGRAGVGQQLTRRAYSIGEKGWGPVSVAMT